MSAGHKRKRRHGVPSRAANPPTGRSYAWLVLTSALVNYFYVLLRGRRLQPVCRPPGYAALEDSAQVRMKDGVFGAA